MLDAIFCTCPICLLMSFCYIGGCDIVVRLCLLSFRPATVAVVCEPDQTDNLIDNLKIETNVGTSNSLIQTQNTWIHF